MRAEPSDTLVGWLSIDGRNPLHQPSEAPCQWTTVNVAEGFPGVPSPLTWSLCGSAFEHGMRGAFFSIGAFRASEVPTPSDPPERLLNVFWGRVATNLDLLRQLAERMPGTSPEKFETQFFGAAESEGGARGDWTRYPVVAAKTLVNGPRSRRSLLRAGEASGVLWRRAVARGELDRAEALALMAEAHDFIARVFVPHTALSMLALGFYSQVEALAEHAGTPGLQMTLLTTGDIEESRAVRELWEVSRGARSLGDFLAEHGFHGPDEGELATRAWREDASPLETLLETYRAMGDAESPVLAEPRIAAERADAERRLLAALPRGKREAARVLVHLGRAYLPMREVGRDAFLKGIDMARLAAHSLGAQLARDGTVEDPEDVFFLTPGEIAAPPGDAKELVAFRRERRAAYEKLRVPGRWTGLVEPLPIDDHEPVPLSGLGVSSGVAEEPARVIRNQAEGHLEPGEILVCHTTDPSWAVYFFAAAGALIEIGGPLSHGAIVARELGLPCVINATGATRQIDTGDHIRIDGTTGTVEVLDRATTPITE